MIEATHQAFHAREANENVHVEDGLFMMPLSIAKRGRKSNERVL